jgi:hypothetical protein
MRNLISKVKGWFTPTEKGKEYPIPSFEEIDGGIFDKLRENKSNGSGKEVTVRMDVLDRMNEVTPPSKSERAKIMELDPTEIVEHAKQNLKEEFDALPFNRISEEAMVEIIRIVKLDIEHQSEQNLRKYSKYSSIMEQLENDMKQREN